MHAYKKILVTAFLSLLFIGSSNLMAAEFHIRAREHFDTVQIDFEKQAYHKTSPGIGPTLNFWFESPYDKAFGLSWGLTYINNLSKTGVTDLDANMELRKTGLEYKHWFSKEGGFFTRLGISHNELITQGALETLNAIGQYYGVGWEFKFEKIGVAFESGRREIRFDHELNLTIFSPSIGIHFYGYI